MRIRESHIRDKSSVEQKKVNTSNTNKASWEAESSSCPWLYESKH